MKVFIVFAHPERKSLSGNLLDVAIDELRAGGHEVVVSDLYRMNWKAQVDRDDFKNSEADQPLKVARASSKAFKADALTEDVIAEQEKLLWADLVIFQFPLCWFSMPAILKGWVDRVFACGFAYGVGPHNSQHWGDRYGEGRMAGKRAMLLVNIGGWQEHYSARGINGPIEDILFPINHGILFYPGFAVLPPHLEYRVDRTGEEDYSKLTERMRERLRTVFADEPILYRPQNKGDYLIPTMLLKSDKELEGTKGYALHVGGG